MAPSSGPPPAHKWLVGVELARYRNEAGLSMAKAATITGITKSKIAHLETGRQYASEDDISRLLAAYGADPRSITRLRALSDRSDEANWWTPWASVVPSWLSIYAGLERLADRAFLYESNFVPGLLQTPDYAAALADESILVRVDRMQQVADFRIARAARLRDPKRPLWLHAVISARALEAPVGTPEIRKAQLGHLTQMAELPTVTIQLLDPGAVATMTTTGFVLLNFDAVSQIGYIELLDDAVYLYHPSRLRTYEVAAKELERLALNPESSIAWIRSMITA